MEYEILKAIGRGSKTTYIWSSSLHMLVDEKGNNTNKRDILHYLNQDKNGIVGWNILEIKLENDLILAINSEVTHPYSLDTFKIKEFKKDVNNNLECILNRNDGIDNTSITTSIDYLTLVSKEEVKPSSKSLIDNFTIKEIKEVLTKILDEDVLSEVIKDLLDYKKNTNCEVKEEIIEKSKPIRKTDKKIISKDKKLSSYYDYDYEEFYTRPTIDNF